MKNVSPTFAFFGTSDYSVMVLEKLKHEGLLPKLVVTTPDKPAGKRLELTPSPVKVWAAKENLPLLQPDKLKDPALIEGLKKENYDVFIVIAYGKIIPKEIIDIPPHGVLNIHASLLPKLRGSSPIETAILEDQKNTGVTIMIIDELMDHGPILAQKEVIVDPWPPRATELGKAIVETGAELLIDVMQQHLDGKLQAQEQNHDDATYTRKIEKTDGLIDLSADPYLNYRKIQAYHKWPTAYFFVEKNGQKIRVIIKKAEYNDGALTILRVVQEGKKEMDYSDFTRSL